MFFGGVCCLVVPACLVGVLGSFGEVAGGAGCLAVFWGEWPPSGVFNNVVGFGCYPCAVWALDLASVVVSGEYGFSPPPVFWCGGTGRVAPLPVVSQGCPPVFYWSVLYSLTVQALILFPVCECFLHCCLHISGGVPCGLEGCEFGWCEVVQDLCGCGFRHAHLEGVRAFMGVVGAPFTMQRCRAPVRGHQAVTSVRPALYSVSHTAENSSPYRCAKSSLPTWKWSTASSLLS